VTEAGSSAGSAGEGSARDRALDALVAVAARLAAADRLAPGAAEPALQAIASTAVALIPSAAASIALHDAPTGRLVFRAAAGPQGGGVVGLDIAAHEGIAGYVFSTGQALAVADVARDPRFERTTAERTGYVPRALLAVPLLDEAGTIGVMELLDRHDGAAFGLGDVEVATRLAAAATAVARASRVDREAGGLLRTALSGIAAGPSGEAAAADADGEALDPAAVDALLALAAERVGEDDNPLWRLADRIARLRAADPDDLELAVAWLDALLARAERQAATGRRRRG
jgi:GAF domain-containing protein